MKAVERTLFQPLINQEQVERDYEMGLWGQINPIIIQAAAKYITVASYLPNMDRTILITLI